MIKLKLRCAFLVDHMTSRTSTFPYDSEQCEKFIKLLTVTGEPDHAG